MACSVLLMCQGGCASQQAWHIAYEPTPSPRLLSTPLQRPETELQDHTPAHFTTRVLENGMRVTALPLENSRVVALRLFYDVGDAHEDPNMLGLAHVVEHLLFGPTQLHKQREYDALVHRMGGSLNAATYMDQTVYETEVVPEQLPTVLAFEADRMQHVQISLEALEREKKVVMEELRMRYDNQPTQRLIRSVQRALAGGHPYGNLGTPESVQKLTLAQVQTFYRRYYQPDHAHLVLAGALQPASVWAAVASTFGVLQGRGEKTPWVPALLEWPIPQQVVFPQDLLPVKVAVLGFVLPGLQDRDIPALLVLEQMLARAQPNLLKQRLVQGKKAVDADMGMFLYAHGGAFYMYAAYLPYRRQTTAFRLLDEVLAEIRSFHWLTAESLQAAQQSLHRAHLFQQYTAAQQAEALGWATVWHGDPRYAFTAELETKQVTLEEVRRVAERYVLSAPATRLFAVPTRVPWWLRAFGWLYPLQRRGP